MNQNSNDSKIEHFKLLKSGVRPHHVPFCGLSRIAAQMSNFNLSKVIQRNKRKNLQ
jgi:hypothetical protein